MRGKLFIDPENNRRFVFNDKEPVVCGGCKKSLGTTGWVCERCKNVFCYDCLEKSEGACKCHHFSREHHHFKSDLEGGVRFG